MASPEVLRARLREEIVQEFPISVLTPRNVDRLIDAIVQVTFDHLTAKATEVVNKVYPEGDRERSIAEVVWDAVFRELR